VKAELRGFTAGALRLKCVVAITVVLIADEDVQISKPLHTSGCVVSDYL
jgi:hypothetical protein